MLLYVTKWYGLAWEPTSRNIGSGVSFTKWHGTRVKVDFVGFKMIERHETVANHNGKRITTTRGCLLGVMPPPQ